MRKIFFILLLILTACSSGPPLNTQGAESLEARVTRSSDDAEQTPSGRIELTSSDLELTQEFGRELKVGMRFSNLALPVGATIESARLQFKVDEPSKRRTVLVIRAEKQDSGTFSNNNGDLTRRTLTDEAERWVVPHWKSAGHQGAAQTSPELKAVVQEAVDAGSTQALTFIVTGSGDRVAQSYDRHSDNGARLYLTYSGGGVSNPGPIPEPTPTPTLGRELIFVDEFSGTTLNAFKWSSGYPWTNPDGNYNRSTGEEQVYLPRNIVLGGGTAKLIGKRENVSGRSYTSGMISSDPRNGKGFLHTYGYIEARIKVPGGKGMWPAFWNLPWPIAWPPEIDIMEVIGSECHAEFHLHPNANYQGTNVCDSWHTYAVDWRPGKIVWYLDGIERYRVEGKQVPSQPMYLLLNLAVGGSWPGSPDSSTPFPGIMEIDYVRVYR